MSNPSGPENNIDPAGSTQMFRAFVDERPARAAAVSASGGGSKTAVAVGVAAVIVVLAAVAWLAFM
jgi:hypothetical protein